MHAAAAAAMPLLSRCIAASLYAEINGGDLLLSRCLRKYICPGIVFLFPELFAHPDGHGAHERSRAPRRALPVQPGGVPPGCPRRGVPPREDRRGPRHPLQPPAAVLPPGVRRRGERRSQESGLSPSTSRADASPKVMVVTKQEASHNAALLTERFVEALNYYAALFDGLEVGAARGSVEHTRVERWLLGEEIMNIVTCDRRRAAGVARAAGTVGAAAGGRRLRPHPAQLLRAASGEAGGAGPWLRWLQGPGGEGKLLPLLCFHMARPPLRLTAAAADAPPLLPRRCRLAPPTAATLLSSYPSCPEPEREERERERMKGEKKGKRE